MASKRIVNIVFQAHSLTSNTWDEAPIVYVLEEVPEDKNIEDILHVLSVALNFKEIRTSRLFLCDPVTSKTACRYSGGYYIARQTFYNKPRK
jgi:hypothetical protein